MTSLRQPMLEDMQVRQLSPRTQQTHVETVARFACHFDRSPALLGPAMAEATGRTEAAIHWHLHQIYQKQSISRQADLVRLVLSLAQLG